MDGNELQEWEAYYELEPWGEERMDLRFAMLRAFLHNALRGQGQPARTAADFMLDFLGDKEEAETDTGEGAFLAMTQMSGGVILDSDMSDEQMEAYILDNSDYVAEDDEGFDDMES